MFWQRSFATRRVNMEAIASVGLADASAAPEHIAHLLHNDSKLNLVS